MRISTSFVLALALIGAAQSAHALTAADCARLEGVTIPPAEIGLPSGPATILSAAWMPDGAAQPRNFCRLIGVIKPVNPASSLISLQVNLPDQWNGKAVQYGGGGFNGVLITGLDPLRDAPLGAPTPVQRGYATWGTDSGHQANSLPEIQAFALDDEALVNFAHASYKKVRDVGARLAARLHGKAPEKIYFFGGSEGGREGLTMAQRFPNDFDGIVSVVPVINWVGLQMAGNRIGVAQQNGGWLNATKIKTLHKAVMAACDAGDGMSDGIVGKFEACAASFQPKSLRCEGGADTGDGCLSDAQITAVETVHWPLTYPFPMANGVTFYPGYNYGSEDQPDGMANWTMGPQPPQSPPLNAETQGRIWYYGNGAMRYFIARDPKFDTLKFDAANFKEQALKISELMDSTNPDLSAFLARGGKLILKENASDYAQSAQQGAVYYKSVVARMGQESVDRFLRFVVTPGAAHSGNGLDASGQPTPRGVDLLGAIDDWSSAGKAPDALVQVAQQSAAPFTVFASRPLCRYPLYPRFKGEGDPKDAANFTCSAQ